MKKRGFGFIFISVWTGLFLVACAAYSIWMITIYIKVIEQMQEFNPIPGGSNATDTLYEFLAYQSFELLCFLIAFIGLLIMIIKLKRSGYFIYTASLVLTIIDIIVINVRLESFPQFKQFINENVLISTIVLLVFYIFLFLPTFFKKLGKHTKATEDMDYTILKKTEEEKTQFDKNKSDVKQSGKKWIDPNDL